MVSLPCHIRSCDKYEVLIQLGLFAVITQAPPYRGSIFNIFPFKHASNGSDAYLCLSGSLVFSLASSNSNFIVIFIVDAVHVPLVNFVTKQVLRNPRVTVLEDGTVYVEHGLSSHMIWVSKVTVMAPVIPDASVQTQQREGCVSLGSTAQMVLMNLFHVQKVPT